VSDTRVSDTRVSDTHYFAELRSLAGDWFAAFGELHAFGWQAAQTRNHTTKAVGTGEQQGEVLYGRDARDALAPAAPASTPTPSPAPGLTSPRADGSHVLRSGGAPVNIRGYKESHVGRVFGWPVHPADLAAMSNAVPGASVKVEYAYLRDRAGNTVPSDVMVSVKGPGYTADRYFRRGADGKLEAHNDLFIIKKPGTPGHNPALPSGTDMLTAQVAALQRAGVARIKTFAAGNPKDPASTLNGYYTWPRLGYDGEVPPLVWKAMPEALRRVAKPAGDTGDEGGSTGSSVRAICLDPAGRAWWKANGRSFDAVFDLTPGSESLRVLAAYTAGRDSKRGAEGGREAGRTPAAAPRTPGPGTFGEGPRRAGQAPGGNGAAGGGRGRLALPADRRGGRPPVTAAPAAPLLHTFSWSDWKPDDSGRMVSPGGRKLPRETWERLSRVSHERVRPGKRGLPQPGEIRNVHPDHVHVDPQRFQFKTRTDPTTGAGRELQGVQTYNPELAGIMAVWHDPADSKTYVVNGHHRLDLARRAKATRVLVRYIHARSAREARAKGALINIAEGRGTAVDAAKFLRDTNTTVEDLAKNGVSLSGPVARDAVTLSNLDPGLFHRVTLGVLDVPRALAVAAHLPDHGDQRILTAHVERQDARTGREMSPAGVAEAAKEMAATPKTAVSGPGGSLFGNDPEDESVFLQRAELKAHIRKELARQAKDFGLLASKRRVESTSGVGNVIDPTKNKAAGEQAKALVDEFDRKVNRSGAVSDVINRAAGRLANAHTEAARDRVFRDVVGEVRRAVEGGGLQMMSEWVGELSPFWTFAWKEGKRGGRYWLPDGRQDVAPNRLYGAKADRAAAAEGTGRQREQRSAAAGGQGAKGPKPGETARVARAKFEVARDAHREASKPGSGATPEQVDWLRKRMERAGEELARHEPARETASPRRAVSAGGGAAGGGKGELLTPEDRHVLAHRRSRWARFLQFAKDKYHDMEDRYGSVGAGVVTAAWLSPFFGAGPAATIVAEVARGAVKGVQAVGHAVGIGGGEPKRKVAPKTADSGHNGTTATAGGGGASGGGKAVSQTKKPRQTHTFSSTRRDGEEWQTNGRWFKRNSGKTVRIPGPSGGATPGSAAAPVPASPAGAATAVAKTAAAVGDFGAVITGARKHTARARDTTSAPAGPAEPGAPKPKGPAQPPWRRVYTVRQDARTGKYFLTRGQSVVYSGGRAADFATPDEAEKYIPLHALAVTHGVANRAARGEPENWVIYRKVTDRKMPVVRAGFATREDAMRHMAGHPEEVLNHTFPDWQTYSYLDHVTRTGPEYRPGDADISTADFQNAFGFRGGQFGNWQMGADGQTSLNHAYDALHDLADATGLTPRDVSLNGQLGIAFGARGHGGLHSAKAHYEPDSVVINLTKMKGAGSLGHEWFHALDHYVAKLEHGPTAALLTSKLPYREGKNPELVAAWKNLVNTMAARAEVKPVDGGEARKGVDRAQESVDRELGAIERTLRTHATSSYFKDRFKPFTPDQQKEWDGLKAKIAAGELGDAVSTGKGFAHLPTFANVAALNALFKKATGRSFLTADDRSQGRDLYWALTRKRDAEKRVAEAQGGASETKKVRTNFLNDAIHLDATRAGDYFTTPEELAARAFSSYLEDKLAAKARKSDYLSARADNKYYAAIGAKPFPEGDERAAINGAFDRLFDALKTKHFTPQPAA
jgi:hypothetical protein